MPVTVADARAPRLAAAARPFGLYLHVPFCSTRCGYCDFNTYTPGELGTSSSPEQWFTAIDFELAAARDAVGDVAVDTVFVGGGTPSLLGADGLIALLAAARRHFRFAPDAEITTESNPESTSAGFFEQIRAGGYTRVSLGMQSAVPHVLRVLERNHSPGRAVSAAKEARAAGFDHVNLDVIYGTPGESDADLARTLDAVLEAGVDHVSAYALIVESGTALARRIRRREVPDTDDDVLASRYQQVDAALRNAGFDWYEVSNFARDAAGRCRHNELYWRGADWWGAGPGAHSHIGGTRLWNVKHPGKYADIAEQGALPVAGYEELTTEERHVEEVMLRVRMRSGLPVAALSPGEADRADAEVRHGNLIRASNTADAGPDADAYVLTDAGRLLADGVVRRILG